MTTIIVLSFSGLIAFFWALAYMASEPTPQFATDLEAPQIE